MGLKDDLKAVSTQLGKARDEIVSKVEELERQINAGEVDQATLDELKAAAQALDDVVPDQPADEPPAEPTT